MVLSNQSRDLKNVLEPISCSAPALGVFGSQKILRGPMSGVPRGKRAVRALYGAQTFLCNAQSPLLWWFVAYGPTSHTRT